MDKAIEKIIKSEKRHIFWSIMIMIAMFLFSVWFGYWLAITNPQDTKNMVQQLFSQFGIVKNLNIFLVFLFIFLNNAIKGFFVLVLGTFFGISAFIFIFINGELIGLVLGFSQGGVGPGKVILGLLPHGILEIPAIVLSASYGLWLGYCFYRFVRFSDPFKIYFSWALREYVSVILPLLLLAAFIETFISPYVVARILR